MPLAVAAHLLQLVLQGGDALAQPPAVGLELGLPGAAQPDPAGAPGSHPPGRPPARLAGQVRPHAGQPRQPVLELGQLHLDLPLAGVGVLGEDVQDEGGAVDQLDLLPERLLQAALLPGGQLLVEDDHAGGELGHPFLQLLDLALADVGPRVGVDQPLVEPVDHLDPRGARQLLQLLEGILQGPQVAVRGTATGQLGADEYGPLGAGRCDVAVRSDPPEVSTSSLPAVIVQTRTAVCTASPDARAGPRPSGAGLPSSSGSAAPTAAGPGPR